MSNRDKLKQLIKDFMPKEESNVISLSRIPKDILKRTREDRLKIVDLLTQALNLLEGTRLFTVNRAREELSFSQHNEVYQKLNTAIEQLSAAKTDEERDKINLDASTNWAKNYIMMIELQDALDDKEPNE